MKKLLQVKTLADWEVVVSEMMSIIAPKDTATIITLHGDLGAGKTTLVQTLARRLGVLGVVSSPTFTIMKSYELNEETGFKYLVHMDAYRIEDPSELKPLNFPSLLQTPNTLLCIEWAEKIAANLPKDIIDISISHTKNEERDVTLVW